MISAFIRSLHPIVALLCLTLAAVSATVPATANDRPVILQSTTSTQNSGLLDHLLPRFTAQTGIDVRTVAVGTGQAIRNAANGDGDLLLVHAKSAEEAFVAEGHGLARYDVMYNDFVIVGPSSDPAGIAKMKDAASALTRISQTKSPFASRGDDSGTHKAELRLWQTAGIDARAASGSWYREVGAGMGATLNLSAGMEAYTLTDRATWISFANKGPLALLVEGDPRLFNQYGVIPVNPVRHPNINDRGAQALTQWLTSPAGQSAIAAYRVNGQQLFFPNAVPAN